MAPKKIEPTWGLKFYNWLKALCHWLARAWVVFLTLVVGVALPGVALCISPVELSARIIGGLLQLGGILTVVWGIRETRKLFGLPTTISKINEWRKAIPQFGGKLIDASVAESATASDSCGSTITYGPRESLPIESRLQLLENSVQSLTDSIDEIKTEIISISEKNIESLEQESAERQKNDHDIRTVLERAETGGLHISAMGAFWLFVGVILTSLPGEIAALFAR